MSSQTSQQKSAAAQAAAAAYAKVTLLQKIVTLQHIHSLFVASHNSPKKPEYVSFNILQLQALINNNPLINPDFDLLNISTSHKSNKERRTAGTLQTKSTLSPVQIVQVIADCLSLDPPIPNDPVISQVPKTTVFRLSSRIQIGMVKERLIKILNHYKNSAVQDISSLEGIFKKRKLEIETIEQGKVNDEVLIREYKKFQASLGSTQSENSARSSPVPAPAAEQAKPAEAAKPQEMTKEPESMDEHMDEKEALEETVEEPATELVDEAATEPAEEEPAKPAELDIEEADKIVEKPAENKPTEEPTVSEEPAVETKAPEKPAEPAEPEEVIESITVKDEVPKEKLEEEIVEAETKESEKEPKATSPEESGESKDEEEELPASPMDVDSEKDERVTRGTKRGREENDSADSSKRRHRSETPTAAPTNKKFQAIATQLITQISSNRFASMFLQPVSATDEPEYYELIKNPQDLKKIQKDVRRGEITTFKDLEYRLQVMFTNAVMYNKFKSETYNWTIEMMEETANLIKLFKDSL